MWSRWVTLAVSWLVLAGVIMALIEVGSPDALFGTAYGRLLLVKVGLVATVMAVAVYSRRLVQRRLAPTRPQALRASVLVEAVVLAAVVAITSVMVQTTPARTALTQEAAVPTDYATVLESPLYRLEVLVEPGRVGSNRVHLYSFHPETGEPLPVEEWSATASLPDAGVERLSVSLVELTDNHVFGEVSLPIAGDWEMRFSLRVSEIQEAAVTTTVPIS